MLAKSQRLSNAFSRQAQNAPIDNGLPLIAAFHVAWPFYRVNTQIDLRMMQSIPFTWLYVLRCIQAGLLDEKNICAFLGVPISNVTSWLNQLAIHGAIGKLEDENQYCLTQLGAEYLDSPMVERLVTLPARLAWDGVRGKISDVLYDELRSRGQRGERPLNLQQIHTIPQSNKLDLPECQKFLTHFLEDMGEEYDGAELLYIHYRNKPARAFKRMSVLLYGFSPDSFEIRTIGDDGFDYDAALLIRNCPDFCRQLPSFFQNTNVAEFIRRANVKGLTKIHELGFDPDIVKSQDEQLRRGDSNRFRTFPGQGIKFLEMALLNASHDVRIVIKENRLIEWESFRGAVADALRRNIVCEIVLAYPQDNREQLDKFRNQATQNILNFIPSNIRPQLRKNLKIIEKRERYRNHWMPLIICDDEWIWCGSEMLPGGSGANGHFGFFMRDKKAISTLTNYVSRQILDIEEVVDPNVEVKHKRKRSFPSEKSNK